MGDKQPEDETVNDSEKRGSKKKSKPPKPNKSPKEKFVNDETKWINGFGKHPETVDVLGTFKESWKLFKLIWQPILGFYLLFFFIIFGFIGLLFAAILGGTMLTVFFNPIIGMLIVMLLMIPMMLINPLIGISSYAMIISSHAMVDQYLRTGEVSATDGFKLLKGNFKDFVLKGGAMYLAVLLLSQIPYLNIAILLLLNFYLSAAAVDRHLDLIETAKSSTRLCLDQLGIIFAGIWVAVRMGVFMIVYFTTIFGTLFFTIFVTIGIFIHPYLAISLGLIGLVVAFVFWVLLMLFATFESVSYTYCYDKYKYGIRFE